MSDKATCPVCDCYASDIYDAFISLKGCPRCNTSWETIYILKDVKIKKEVLKKEKIESGLIERNEFLERQNAFLLDKVFKIESGIWSIISSFEESLETLIEYAKSIKEVREEIKKK